MTQGNTVKQNDDDADGNVYDIFDGDGWNGESGIKNIEKKLNSVGYESIKALRTNSFEVSNRLYILMSLVVVVATVLSGAISMNIGAMSAPTTGMAFMQSGWYFCFQAVLLFCGTVIGCYAYGRVDKKKLALMTLVVMIPVFIISVTTGMAQQYQMQTGELGNPLLTLFTAISPENPLGLQLKYNLLTTICFDFNLVFLPIILMSISCPIRENWELKKLTNAAIQRERSERELVSIIAKGEAEQVKHDANMAYLRESTIAATNLKMIDLRIDTVNKIHAVAGKQNVITKKGIFGDYEEPVKKHASPTMINMVLGNKKVKPRRTVAKPVTRPKKRIRPSTEQV